MMAVSASALPEGEDWTYEVKWDGYRAQAVKNGSSVSLASRNLKNLTRQFPSVAQAVSRLRAKTVLLDGEIVALDAGGRPSFQALHHANLDGLSIVYYAFDLLHLNGRDLTRALLDDRRAVLRDVIGGSGVLLSDELPGTPAQIVAAVRRLQLEGVVAKRRRSAYAAGRRSHAWIKVRFASHQEFVVGGFKPAGRTFESLVVGHYEGSRLLSAGKVRSGLTPQLRRDLYAKLAALQTDRCPFANLPSGASSHWGEGITETEMRLLHWVKPRLVVEVSFTEWTRDGSLRHAAFMGLRGDKAAKDVVREESGQA